MTMEAGEFQERTRQIEALVQRVQALGDENARAAALDLLRALMDMHGAVLDRIVELAVEANDSALLARLCGDPMISGMLVLYGLHPLGLEERITAALDKVRPDLQSRGSNVELLSVSEAVVRCRISTNGHGCGSTADIVMAEVERAISEAAPEVPRVEVEGAAAASAGSFVPLATLQPITKENRHEESAA